MLIADGPADRSSPSEPESWSDSMKPAQDCLSDLFKETLLQNTPTSMKPVSTHPPPAGAPSISPGHPVSQKAGYPKPAPIAASAGTSKRTPKALWIILGTVAAVFIVIVVAVIYSFLSLFSSTHSPWNRLKKEAQVINDIGMTFVKIPAGAFNMGSEGGEFVQERYVGDIVHERYDFRGDERPVHPVTISKPFYMQTTEVTQAQWKAVMGNNSSVFHGNDFPVAVVSWEDVQEFIRRLNVQDPGKGYQLPTEAEWEYACRAGSTGDRYGDLNSIAWYAQNSGHKPHPVGQKKPNAWGLYDMLGNVWEWCSDWYGGYPSTAVTDPTGIDNGSKRVIRGGGWSNLAAACRSARRGPFKPNFKVGVLGFRLVRAQQ